MAGGAVRVADDGRGGMGWRHGQAPRDTQRVCQPPDAAGLGQQPRGQCPADSAVDAAMDGRRTGVLDRDGSAVCRVGGIGGRWRRQQRPDTPAAGAAAGAAGGHGCDAVCLVCAREGCGLFAGSGRLCAVCGGRAALPRARHRRATHDITHTATDQRCRSMHTSTWSGRVDMGCGCGVWASPPSTAADRRHASRPRRRVRLGPLTSSRVDHA